MESENERFNAESAAQEQSQHAEGREGGYQPTGRQGRSPRPRIHQQVRPYQGGGDYRQNDNNEEFRPEGFGGGLNGGYQPRSSYRPRNNNYNNNGGYGQHQGGYQRREGYGQQQGGYQRREGYGQQGGYQRREGYGQQQGGYQRREGYGQQQGGYQRREGYGQQQGGYQPRGGYGQQGGYQQRGGYGQQGGYQQRGGFNKRPRGNYDPNAKYSLKKRIEYKEEHFDPNEPVRLNKFLANAGVCSRREADEYIQAGVVTVNGNVVTELGTKVLRSDEVRFHDQPVVMEKKVYVLLNKPKDYVTTSDDPQQRKTVMDLVKNACRERIYPVGRLDRNTTGVLLLTNDGELASKLTHPKYLKKKIYHVCLDHNVTAHDLQQIAEGVQLEDGEIKADAIEYADPVDKKQVGIEIHSGKNRIVRRIFESLGYKVTKLDRVQFAGLTKKNVRRGDWRYLTEEEVDRLRMGAYE